MLRARMRRFVVAWRENLSWLRPYPALLNFAPPPFRPHVCWSKACLELARRDHLLYLTGTFREAALTCALPLIRFIRV